ncbi:hypothetical protein PHMEG_00033919, partial [Phytophthora megakarya]
RSQTVFDGSSIYSADGGIPVDYEDGELEDEVTSSSQSHESKPATGNRRPREDDSDASSSKRPRSESDAVPSGLEALAITSDQRDATRTDDTVRAPWMPSEEVIKDRYGAMVAPNPVALYFDNRIVDDEVSQMVELRQELFLQKAYVAEAAQTTSNIRVEVLEQVRLLQEKVKRLEEKLRTRRASSSASHHD